MRLTSRGTWPGPVVLRRGWARADARPWNDAYADAHLRLMRGGSAFLQDSTREVLGMGAPSVFSPPLPATAQRPWRQAGYESHCSLALLRLELTSVTTPDHLVAEAPTDDLSEAIRIDRMAFKEFWRLDEAGMREALGATDTSLLLVIRDSEGGWCGFSIVGFGSALSYLQRLAVDPPWQGQGMGRSLVRASARVARQRGASALLLNTQDDNGSALGLYASEGFVTLQEPLELLRCAG